MSHYGSERRYRSSSRERDSRRHGSSRRSSGSRRRSPSPGPSSRGRSPARDPKSLPESFTRMSHSGIDDDLNVLQRMRTSFVNLPLDDLNRSIAEKRKLKVWTRNFREIRGVCSGTLIAFDKHWNLVMRNVEEIFLRPPKFKTPFLRDIMLDEDIEEMKPRQPKERRPEPEPMESAASETEGTKPEEKKRKRRKKKKKAPSTERRMIGTIFIRGDNIVTIAILKETEEDARSSGGENASP